MTHTTLLQDSAWGPAAHERMESIDARVSLSGVVIRCARCAMLVPALSKLAGCYRRGISTRTARSRSGCCDWGGFLHLSMHIRADAIFTLGFKQIVVALLGAVPMRRAYGIRFLEGFGRNRRVVGCPLIHRLSTECRASRLTISEAKSLDSRMQGQATTKDIFGASLLRFCRLIRLVRVVMLDLWAMSRSPTSQSCNNLARC